METQVYKRPVTNVISSFYVVVRRCVSEHDMEDEPDSVFNHIEVRSYVRLARESQFLDQFISGSLIAIRGIQNLDVSVHRKSGYDGGLRRETDMNF